MTTVNNKNINFTFRNKFEVLLNDENRPIITVAFEKFCSNSPDTARNLLWRMTYNTDVASAVLSQLGLDSEIIPFENVSAFRNELRFQYEKLRPGFLTVEVPKECQEVFKALKNHTDAIVANVVYEHCQSRIYVKENFQNRLLFLLKSDKENHYFGGIRTLYFNQEEAEYLKPFHMQIHDLLEVLYEYKQQRDSSFKNMPLAGLANLLYDSGLDMEEETVDEELSETPAEEPVQTKYEFKPLTPEEILAHKDAFETFVNNEDMKAIFLIGFDLNEVMAKKEEIYAFLKAAKALSQ